jgi:hypothetical protein
MFARSPNLSMRNGVGKPGVAKVTNPRRIMPGDMESNFLVANRKFPQSLHIFPLN